MWNKYTWLDKRIDDLPKGARVTVAGLAADKALSRYLTRGQIMTHLKIREDLVHIGAKNQSGEWEKIA